VLNQQCQIKNELHIQHNVGEKFSTASKSLMQQN